MKSFSVKLNDRLASQLQLIARRTKRSKSELMGMALKAYFANGNGHAGDRPTCAELAGDLIGSLEGPGDLSYNPKHMEGFGR